MSNIKERIIGALSIMNDDDAASVWAFIQDGYMVKAKTWDDIEEAEPAEDELEIIKKYNSGDSDFLPSVTHDELRKQMNL